MYTDASVHSKDPPRPIHLKKNWMKFMQLYVVVVFTILTNAVPLYLCANMTQSDTRLSSVKLASPSRYQSVSLA